MPTDPPTPPDSPFELSAGSYQSGELRVLSFDGHEEANGLYAFDLRVWGQDLDEGQVEAAVLGAPASLAIRVSDSALRYVRGIVSAIAFDGKQEHGRHAFHLHLVPKMWLLGKRVRSRIFQELTVQQIVDAVLEEHGVARLWNLFGKYPVRQYCVEYQESDLAFVTRILAEEGIFFWFDHPADGDGDAEQLVLGDDARAYEPIDGDTRLVFRRHVGEGGMRAEENHVVDFRARTRIEPTAVMLRDYDFRRPLLDLTSSAPDPSAAPPDPPDPTMSIAGPALEVYDHHGEYEETDADTGNAATYLEQLRAGVREAEGASLCRRLLPGHRFDLSDHDVEKLNASWVVARVEHRAALAGLGRHGERLYENHLRCVPASVPLRPARPPRVLRQVTESAVVVGPEGQEIFTDSYGRIKVQFHWDREGKRDERSSCWMRVAQAWAGTGWGFQFIPRIGMEVLVTFLGGDQDRPVVTGCVYNAVNPASHALPGQAERSGIRTRTVPGGGGYNEIAFDDRAGREQLHVHAQRDHDEEVGRDRTMTVGNDRREVIERDSLSMVQGNRTDETSGDHQILVRGTRAVKVEGDDVRHVQGEARETLGGNAEMRIVGTRQIRVTGAQSLHVGADAEEILHGNHLCYVQGEDTRAVSLNATTTIHGSASINIEKGMSVVVGTKGKPAPAEATIAGDLSLKVTGKTEIVLEGEVRIRSGKSTIAVGPNGVEIQAEKIKLSADSIEGASASSTLNMGDKVEISGKSVKIWSKDKAILQLDEAAQIDGPAVKIKPGLAAEAAESAKREEQAKTLDKQSVQLHDRTGKPIQNAPYEVSFFGWLDQGTAADGQAQVPKFPDVEQVHLRWGRPKDQRENPNDPDDYEFEMEIYLQTDVVDEGEALRRKLHNMGHQGLALHEAVHSFQLATGQPPTLVVDDVKRDVESRHAAAQPITADEKGA